jgi:hypothetical protein
LQAGAADDLPAVPTSGIDEMEQSVDHLARAVETAVLEVSSTAVRGSRARCGA